MSTEVHYDPQSLASIMRAIFALLLDDYPEMEGQELFIKVQGYVQKLREIIQAAYGMQFGKYKSPGKSATVTSEELALVLLGMVERGDVLDDLLQVSPRKLLKMAREAL